MHFKVFSSDQGTELGISVSCSFKKAAILVRDPSFIWSNIKYFNFWIIKELKPIL